MGKAKKGSPLAFEARLDINMNTHQLVDSLLAYHSHDELFAIITAIDEGAMEYEFTERLVKHFLAELKKCAGDDFDFEALRP